MNLSLFTLKNLSELRHQYDCRRYPNTEPHKVLTETFTDKTEKDLMDCVECYCMVTNCGYFWRTPNKSSQVGTKAKMKKGVSTNDILSGMATESVKPVFGYSSGTNGMSDMSGFICVNKIPIQIALEIKIPGDTQKKDQIKFEKTVKDRGGIYAIIQDINDFHKLVNKVTNRMMEVLGK